MKKKILALIVIFAICATLPASVFASSAKPSAVTVNGKAVDTPAIVSEGSLYLPLRAVCEALGLDVLWSGKDNTVSITAPGRNVVLDYKNGKITSDEHTYFMAGEYYGSSPDGSAETGSIKYMEQNFFSDNFGVRVEWDKAGNNVKLESITENNISVKTVNDSSQNNTIKITLQYPQLDGLANKDVQDKLNTSFKQMAMQARNEGLQNADDLVKSLSQGFVSTPNRCETYFDYSLKYNQNGLISLTFTDYQYSGGAHGLTVQSSDTYNLETGDEMQLKDFFNTGADYVSLISNAVSSEINDRVNAGTLPPTPLEPFKSIKDNQDFYISSNGIVIYFQEYEYYPYAAGILEFPVDFNVLKGILKSDFTSLIDLNIPYKNFFRGFATMKADAAGTFPKGTLVIASDSDWHDFMDKYLPGIPYNSIPDFSKESLVYTGLFPAKSTYTAEAGNFTGFSLRSDSLDAEYMIGDINGNADNGAVVQNIDGITHCYVSILIVNKSDIPANIKNIYASGK